ncbi:hypothetical protein ACFQVC_06860 [Streptomyces monticola]|uniref:Secreted protein n=1 Tax=Streptomyces monticola TaxID=2666263 RepID=A0ABW2JEH0_9ACTN
MDQGWAAVVAGIVGLVAALGGAAVGGRAAVRGAQVSGNAAHRLWLRQERTRIYEQVHAAYADVAIEVPRVEQALRRREAPSDADTEEMRRAWAALRIACAGTQLFGPGEVVLAAMELRRLSTRCRSNIERWREAVADACTDEEHRRFSDRGDEHRLALRRSHELFMQQCQQVLLGSVPEGTAAD